MQRFLLGVLLVPIAAHVAAGEAGPLVLRKPTINRTHVVFSYAGDLWSVRREGGDARRLTTASGIESDPIFSPDGSSLAFVGEMGGNPDVYVMPAEGGNARRLTYHPDYDRATGWTPDGKRVLFASPGSSHGKFWRLFTVAVDGGYPEELPLPMGSGGAFSPDGARIAYVPLEPMFRAWKRYRGGATTAVWIADLADSRIVKVPRGNSNDFNPMWVGERVYFLSDRNGPFTLFSYDTRTQQVRQVLENSGMDLNSASAGPGAVVYEQFGGIHLFDLASGRSTQIPVRIAAEMVKVEPRDVKAARSIVHAAIAPGGARAVFEARGEIVTVAAGTNSVCQLTHSSGAADRDPAWSPDGRKVAYFSDQSGEYRLHITDQEGKTTETFDLGDPPTFYHSPRWSPDGTKIVYTDKRLQLWYLDIARKTNTRVDANRYDFRTFDAAWSPDGRWIAYTKQLKSYLHAVFVANVETGAVHQLTDGLSDARYPVFDWGGRYLYFTASTDTGPTTFWEMSGLFRPVTRNVYVAVLAADAPSPLAPAAGLVEPVDRVRIDVEGIEERILPLPIPAKNYVGLQGGKGGTLFVLEGPAVVPGANGTVTVHRFDLATRRAETLLTGVSSVHVSPDGAKVLYRKGNAWQIAGTAGPDQAPVGLAIDAVKLHVDPRAEWRQMYREVWRIERDYLYDPRHHGLDLKAAERTYEPYLAGVSIRAELNLLFNEMLGELSLGHVFAIGGDIPDAKPVKVGLLGCDYRIENGRYRVTRVYRGEGWNPQVRSPLTVPGVNVKEGEYLLAVDGRDLGARDNIHHLFENRAGRPVPIKVGPTPDGDGARVVTVVPLDNDVPLRRATWVESNRREVDRLTGGRIAYIAMSDTWVDGYRQFNRMFFAQLGKDGAIIDDRFNGGGLNPDYVIDLLRRGTLNRCTTREGEDQSLPQAAIHGPKVMLMNELSTSGGDNLAWYFRAAKLGPLIGKRTWGGAVGYDDYPLLIDGGFVTAPRWAFYNLEGRWDIENHGVDPDAEVELDPCVLRAGHDPQLERAVEVVMEALGTNPPPKYERPAYPDYHQRMPDAGKAVDR